MIVLKKYLEYGYFNKTSASLALILGAIGEKLNSLMVKANNNNLVLEGNASSTFKITAYNGNIHVVKSIANYLNEIKNEAIVVAIIHGSISDNTTNNFSDFDGVLIYDQNKLKNSKEISELRKIIRETHLMMFDFDALQHHSWMLVEQNELLNFNENIFPSVIFEGACFIYPSNYNTITIKKNTNTNPKLPFLNLTRSIEQKLIAYSNLKYFYCYKNLVSEILLLPATWHQAFTGKPITKKESFTKSKQLLNSDKWHIIEFFESVRLSWNQSSIDKSKEIKSLKYRTLKQYSLNLRNSTPKEYLILIDDKVISSIKELINEMKIRIN